MKRFVPLLMKRAIRRTIFSGWRVPTAPVRLLPDFIIIGAQRCGTTSLYFYLTKHPCIVPAFTKEVHFFDKNFVKGVAWYRAHFPSFSYRTYVEQIRKQNLVTGEATPYYIFHPAAPKRISEVVPEVKLIALLRNPVDRAYSHYQYEVRRGRETLSFEDAIGREVERLSGERERILRDGSYYSFNHQRYSYLSRGIYMDQLRTWIGLFPKEQMLILKSGDFYADPPTMLGRILEFLNLPSWELKEYKTYNRASYPRMNAVTRKRLIDYFNPHNQRLYEYLGMSLDWDR